MLIDFTRPEGTLAHLAVCRELGVNAVIGTTGFSPAQKAEIAGHAERIAIVMAPNMSVGVNVVMKLLEVAARALDESYDIEIVETHHRLKVDAPSGTALQMGEVVAAARGTTLEADAVYARHGDTGARRGGSIGFAVAARRRHRRRPHRAVRRRRRADRDHASLVEPGQLRPGQPAGRPLPRRPQGAASTAWPRCSASTLPAAEPAHDRLREFLGPGRCRSPAASRPCCWRCRSAPGS